MNVTIQAPSWRVGMVFDDIIYVSPVTLKETKYHEKHPVFLYTRSISSYEFNGMRTRCGAYRHCSATHCRAHNGSFLNTWRGSMKSNTSSAVRTVHIPGRISR
jgi:hypothetical protein